MHTHTDVVVTGLGLVTPLGLDSGSTWEALMAGQSGIGRWSRYEGSRLPCHIAGEVKGFDPKAHIRPLKSIKLLSPDSQYALVAAKEALAHAGVAAGGVDPDRFGVVLGADVMNPPPSDPEPCFRACVADGEFDIHRWGPDGMPRSFPLMMLKVLPNMLASHISIAHDARGPNNTIHHDEVSGICAISEAARAIERGAADVMVAGGASSRVQIADWCQSQVAFRFSTRTGDPEHACRPFERDRDGQVRGEGAAILVLESRRHAEARGAKILAQVLSAASVWSPASGDEFDAGLARAMESSLSSARMTRERIGYVSANGLSTVSDDRREARTLRRVLDRVPVTAPKSSVGNLCAAAGALETALAILAIERGQIPPTLNYDRADPDCPVEVIHRQPATLHQRTAMILSQTAGHQSAGLIVAGP